MASKLLEKWTKPENLIRIQGWAMDGLTMEQIAKNIGVHVATLYDWQNKSDELFEALKKSKDVADREVECALHRKATGYDQLIQRPQKVKRTIYNDEGKKTAEYEEFILVDDVIHYPPDTTAQIFWLKNRKPKDWRDKVVVQDDAGLAKLDGLINSITELAKARVADE